MAAIKVHGVAVTGAVTGRVKNFTLPEEEALLIETTSLEDAVEKFIDAGFKRLGEFSMEVAYEGTAYPTVGGAASTLTFTFAGGGTFARQVILTKVGAVSGSVGQTDELTLKITAKVVAIS